MFVKILDKVVDIINRIKYMDGYEVVKVDVLISRLNRLDSQQKNRIQKTLNIKRRLGIKK